MSNPGDMFLACGGLVALALIVLICWVCQYPVKELPAKQQYLDLERLARICEAPGIQREAEIQDCLRMMAELKKPLGSRTTHVGASSTLV